LYDQEACAFNELRGPKSGCRDWQDAIGIPLYHESGDIDSRQVFAKVFMPSSDARQAGGSRGAGGNVPTGLDGLFADALSQEHIAVVEILKEAGEEGVPVGRDRLPDSVEDAAIHAFRIVGGLEQVWRHSRNDHGFAHTLGTVFS